LTPDYARRDTNFLKVKAWERKKEGEVIMNQEVEGGRGTDASQEMEAISSPLRVDVRKKQYSSPLLIGGEDLRVLQGIGKKSTVKLPYKRTEKYSRHSGS